GMTAFYVFRAMFMTFFGQYRGHAHPHEAPRVMTVPLVILALLSLVGGYLRVPTWLGNFFPTLEAPEDFSLVAISVTAGLLGIVLAILMHRNPGLADSLARNFGVVYRTVSNKYYVDEIYD